MKLKVTKEEKAKLTEVLTKHRGMNEGIIKWIFNKYLTSKIKNDSDIMSKLTAADKAMDNLKDSIADVEKRGYKVDPELKKMVGLK
jgi:glutathione peroxidase-family protein